MRFLSLLVALFALSSFSWADSNRGTPIWDDGDLPPGWPEENLFNVLASMNSWTKPVLDHTGQPHAHGHIVQLIMDGGNNIQDPPSADGQPGGDDSLAYGNFNMIRVLGIEGDDNATGKTGMFFSKKFFIPLVPQRSFYLRIWEGKDEKTAPYYQDTIEYTANDDRGGKMIKLRSGQPMDIDWTFGASQPRPGGNETQKKDKKK